VVRQTLTTDRLTLRPSKETILSICFSAGRPSFTLSMALRDANELSSRLHARLGIRLVVLMMKTVKFTCYSIESSLKLRFPFGRGRSQPWKALEEVQSGLSCLISLHPSPPSLHRDIGKNKDQPNRIPATRRPYGVLFLWA